MSETQRQFPDNLVFYKAKANGSGYASQWNISSKRDAVYLEMAAQVNGTDNKSAKFDWDNKLVFKLSSVDIGEILSVLAGMKRAVGPYDKDNDKFKGLFHKNQNGNAVLYFGREAKSNLLSIFLRVNKGDSKRSCTHVITDGEACVLATLLRKAIETIYRW